jgi:hypothetical protein
MVLRAKLMKTGIALKSMAEQLEEAKVTAVETTLCTCNTEITINKSFFLCLSNSPHDDF